MTAAIFTVSRHNLYVGAAVVCVEARYFSVTIPSVKRIFRRSVPPDKWVAIQAEMTGRFNREPLPKSSAIARLICNEDPAAYSVQCVAQPLIKAVGPDEIASDLDKLLREVCALNADADTSPKIYKEA